MVRLAIGTSMTYLANGMCPCCRLQNQVIDLEVANRTASPTVDPSVHVFLVGHSMGGIVAAETLLLLSSEQPISAKHSSSRPEDASSTPDSGIAGPDRAVEPGSFMFPHIQGVLAFDTPYLGIAPGVISYGAEGHYNNMSSAYNTFSDVAGMFGIGGKRASGSAPGSKDQTSKSPPTSGSASTADAAATPSWQRWGRYAMFAGAAGAVAAGGAAAMYSQRERIADGWGWVSSHLAFVGCLTRAQELRERLNLMYKVHEERGIRCTNFYTCLGGHAASTADSANQGKTSFSQRIIRSKHRTFCSLPDDIDDHDPMDPVEPGIRWVRAVNDKAADEVKAHVSMFIPKDNPEFDGLAMQACDILVKSIDKGWYSTATRPVEEVDEESPPPDKRGARADTECQFMDGDDVVLVD